MRNDGLDFNTNRYQRGTGFVEDERLSLVNNAAAKLTNGPSDPNALKQKVDVTLSTIRDPSVPNLSLPPFNSKFPLSDRFSKSIFGCFKQ
jgi:hypothetical protein